jgi:L-iditol 2-dehydrogenase
VNKLLENKMRALKLYAPGDIRLDETPIPVIDAGEVLVRVMAVGVCGSDIPRILTHGAYHPRLTMGHEFSGVVVQTGERVDQWRVGQRVVAAPLIPCFDCQACRQGRYSLCADYNYIGSRTNGAMAEYVRVPAINLLELQDNVPFEAGAMVDPAANAIHALWKTNVQEGKTVAVYGSGPIGLFSIQLARHLGATRVIAVDIMEEKLSLAKKAGADDVINSRHVNPVEAVKEITHGKGVDITLDISGAKTAQHQAICSAGNSGTVVLVGISHDSLELSKEAVDGILRRELIIRGSWNSFSPPFPGAEWTRSLSLMAEGLIWKPEFISHRLRLEEGQQIFAALKNKEFFFSKIIFFPQEK